MVILPHSKVALDNMDTILSNMVVRGQDAKLSLLAEAGSRVTHNAWLYTAIYRSQKARGIVFVDVDGEGRNRRQLLTGKDEHEGDIHCHHEDPSTRSVVNHVTRWTHGSKFTVTTSVKSLNHCWFRKAFYCTKSDVLQIQLRLAILTLLVEPFGERTGAIHCGMRP